MAYAIIEHLGQREARHARTVDALHAAHARLREQVMPAVRAVIGSARSSLLLLPIRGLVNAKADEVSNDLEEAERQIANLITYVFMPFWLWRNGEGWTEVREECSSMVGDLGATNREIHVLWRGAAADAYHAVLSAQVAAAGQLASAAATIHYAVGWVGTTMALFFVALLGIIANLIAGLIAALVTAATGVLEFVSLLQVGLTAAETIIALGVLVVVTLEATARVKIWTNQVLGALRDNSGFPNGEWPAARTDWYSDGTVTDGDADWSVVPR